MNEAARDSMIDLLEADGALTDTDVKDAFHDVDRERFLTDQYRSLAWTLEEVPVAEHVIALNPRTIAEILSIARPSDGMSVILLGTSTGYVEALLAEIGCRVRVIEPNEAQRAYVNERLEHVEFITTDEAERCDLVISLKSIDNLDPRLLAWTPYGRTMLIVGEDHTLIALDYHGDPKEPIVSYSGSVWVPRFDPPLFDE